MIPLLVSHMVTLAERHQRRVTQEGQEGLKETYPLPAACDPQIRGGVEGGGVAVPSTGPICPSAQACPPWHLPWHNS